MIELNNESGDTSLDELALLELSAFALRQLRIHPQSDLSILMVDPDTMAIYHERHMGLEGPTDVMSFPMDELRAPVDDEPAPLGMLGDIMLCPALLVEQASGNGRTPDAEAQYMLVHSLLHLVGHDHAEPQEKALMWALNDRIIADWQASRA